MMHLLSQMIILLLVLFCGLHLCIGGQNKKSSKIKNENQPSEAKQEQQTVRGIALPKEVVVIGAGIAGLAAARRLSSDRSNFTVTLYEARRDRYGGRVWTDKLKNMKARGAEVDLGGSAFNVVAKNNPLIELAESFELKSATISNLQFIIPWENQVYSGDDLSHITHLAAQILSQAINNSRSAKIEISIKDAIDQVLKTGGAFTSDSPASLMVKCLPSYILENYSTHNYKAEVLDVGFNKILIDGMGELMDRLLSGSLEEIPLHLNLNKAARQIKIDKERGKVVVRFSDGLQKLADMVVVAVPSTVIASGALLFEPDLPKQYRLAASEINISAGDKVIVEFEHAFWPADFDVFLRAVKSEAERGSLQTWINLNKIVGKPALTSLLLGESAVAFEKMNDEDVEHLIITVLNEMFGEEKVKQGGKIVSLQRSQWSTDPWSRGASSYPKVGSDPNMWDTFAKPLCPYIYFAGEYTIFENHGTLHGAYNSGIHAADQILSGLCETLRLEEQKRKAEERRKKQAAKKNKTKTGNTLEEKTEIADAEDDMTTNENDAEEDEILYETDEVKEENKDEL